MRTPLNEEGLSDERKREYMEGRVPLGRLGYARGYRWFRSLICRGIWRTLGLLGLAWVGLTVGDLDPRTAGYYNTNMWPVVVSYWLIIKSPLAVPTTASRLQALLRTESSEPGYRERRFLT